VDLETIEVNGPNIGEEALWGLAYCSKFDTTYSRLLEEYEYLRSRAKRVCSNKEGRAREAAVLKEFPLLRGRNFYSPGKREIEPQRVAYCLLALLHNSNADDMKKLCIQARKHKKAFPSERTDPVLVSVSVDLQLKALGFKRS